MRDGSTDEFRALRIPPSHHLGEELSPTPSPTPDESDELPPFLTVRTGDEYEELTENDIEFEGPPPIPSEARLREKQEPKVSLPGEEHELVIHARNKAMKAFDIPEFKKSHEMDEMKENCTMLGYEFQIKINPDGTLPRGGVLGLFDKNKKRFDTLFKTDANFRHRYEAAVDRFHHKPKLPKKDAFPRSAVVAGALVGGTVAGTFAHNQESHIQEQTRQNIASMSEKLSEESTPSSIDSPFIEFEMKGERGLDAQNIDLKTFTELHPGDSAPAPFLAAFESLSPGSKKVVERLNTATTVEAFKNSQGQDFITVSFEGIPQRIYKVENGKVTQSSSFEKDMVKTFSTQEETAPLSTKIYATKAEKMASTSFGDFTEPKPKKVKQAATASLEEDELNFHDVSSPDTTSTQKIKNPLGEVKEDNKENLDTFFREVKKSTARTLAENDLNSADIYESDTLAPQNTKPSRTTRFDVIEQGMSGKKGREAKIPLPEHKTVTITNAGRTGNFYDAIVRQIAHFNKLDIKNPSDLKEAQKLTDDVLKQELKKNPEFLNQVVSKKFLKTLEIAGVKKPYFKTVKEALQSPLNTGKASITLSLK